MTNCISAVYAENKIKLSWLIKSIAVYEENQIGQRRDQSNRFGLHWKRLLNYWDLSNWVLFVIKTKQDNDMTDCISVVYVKTETELLGPIELGAVCYQNQTGQRHDRPYRCCLHWKQNWVVVINQIEWDLW